MAIITPAPSLYLGTAPSYSPPPRRGPLAKMALELCTRAAAVIDRERQRGNPPADSRTDKHTDRTVGRADSPRAVQSVNVTRGWTGGRRGGASLNHFQMEHSKNHRIYLTCPSRKDPAEKQNKTNFCLSRSK